MTHIFERDSGCRSRRDRGEDAGVRGLLLALTFLLVLAALSAVWLYHSAQHRPAVSGEPAAAQPIALSDSTLAVLRKLDSVVDIRFYSILDPASVPDSTVAFSRRVDQLLQAYQQAAGGKIKVTRFDSQSNLNPNIPLADGMQAFNQDKGEACYLGVALVLKGRKETLPRLSPEWEQALEPDLTRALIRLVDATRPAAVVASSQVNTNAVQEVKALIPNLGNVSVEEGTRILREAALKDYTAVAKEMQAQVKEAQQRLSQAQNGGSDADQQAAIKHLQQVQAEQSEKLDQIAARSKAQIDAFQLLKAAPH
jgi:ABC-type uncharacterized transport system